MNYSDLILTTMASPIFLRATFSGPQRLSKSPIQRATVRLIELRGRPHLQLSRFTQKQDFTSNHPLSEAPTALAEILAIGFANVHLTTTEEELDLRLLKKLELAVGREKRPNSATSSPGTAVPGLHNRRKSLPLPEDRSDHILQLMGIMTSDGQILPTMRAKYTQINHFLQLLDHALHELAPFDTQKPLTIVDCGSGSAYLTIATHHYLNDIKKIPATLLGVDLNEDLIKKSTHLASQLPPSASSVPSVSSVVEKTLQFKAARIGQLENIHPDIVLALHACDTATDDAIAQAIKSNARLLLAAPCCHKNLNKKIHAPVLDPIHHQGILHQRLADLITDAFRAQILRIMGYRTDVLEFISPEHTAKNLMIRALKIPNTPDPKFLTQYQAMKSFFSVTPYLETLLAARLPKLAH